MLAPEAAHFGAKRQIKVECDMLDFNGHVLYPTFSPPFTSLGNSSAILTPPATHGDSGGGKSTPPAPWTPSTPTRISTVDSLGRNDSAIVSDCPTDGSDAKSAKRDSVSSGDDMGHRTATSPSLSNEDEDDDMTNDMDEEEDDEEVEEEEDDEQDTVGDALSRLQRALDANRSQNGGHPDVYQCHLCSYSGTSRFHFQAHLNTHFDVKCTHCDFTARTEGKLRAHMRNAHGVVDSGRQGRSARVSTSSKSKSFKCKQCQFVAVDKMGFWQHSRSHIKAEKLLTCPKCPFVTEYKHHLEYHMRNHFGSKPFKCPKCSYSCVNKSMLNSHMKSHSNVYQYRCADCAYATKYCHSLKLHLRKYAHTPTVEIQEADEASGNGPARKRTRKRQSKSKATKEDARKRTVSPQPPEPSSGGAVNSIPAAPVGYGFPLSLLAGSYPTGPLLPANEDVPVKKARKAEESENPLRCNLSCADKEQVHASAGSAANLFGVDSNPTAPACSSSPLGHKIPADVPQVKDYLRMFNPLLFATGFAGAPLLAARNQFRDTDGADSDSNRTATPEATPKRSHAAPLDLSRDKDDSTLPPGGQNKHRRKGQAFKLERPRQSPPLSSHSMTPSPPPAADEKGADASAIFTGSYQCNYCDIAFKDVVMYTMHMGYHGYQDPFTCNMCGQQTNDKLAFFLHIARSSHL